MKLLILCFSLVGHVIHLLHGSSQFSGARCDSLGGCANPQAVKSIPRLALTGLFSG